MKISTEGDGMNMNNIHLAAAASDFESHELHGHFALTRVSNPKHHVNDQ